jgi:hypothetical protein
MILWDIFNIWEPFGPDLSALQSGLKSRSRRPCNRDDVFPRLSSVLRGIDFKKSLLSIGYSAKRTFLDQNKVVMRSRRKDWWSEAEIPSVRGMYDAIDITKLLEVRFVKHAADQKPLDAWLLDESRKICEELDDHGVRDFVAVCMSFGAFSLVMSCEVIDDARLRACLAQDPLARRLKLVLNPVQVKLPFPAKGPEGAEAIGCFFDESAVSLQSCESCRSGKLVHLRIDVCSKLILKFALKVASFRIGNVVEFLIVDWAGADEKPAVLAAFRLSVTEEFLNMLG